MEEDQMYWFAKWVAATPENIGARLFRGDAEQGKLLLGLFVIAHNKRPPASMQELLLWVDAEAEQVRIDWRDRFDWRKFQEQIERKFAGSPPKKLVEG
jgi:hypothetical protein